MEMDLDADVLEAFESRFGREDVLLINFAASWINKVVPCWVGYAACRACSHTCFQCDSLLRT